MVGQNNSLLLEINFHALKKNANLIKRVTQFSQT
jgi:hypothetical protein